jgi:prepilin-type N-terminal cleavage/methylation domain-containing protein
MLKYKNRGFNLIELMVATAVGLIVIAAVTSFIASTIQASNLTVQSTRLNQELRSVAEIVSRELRRARAAQDPISDVGSGCVVAPTTPAVCSTATPPVDCPTCTPPTKICCATRNWRDVTFSPAPTATTPASCVVFGYQNAVGGDFRAMRRIETSGVGSISVIRQGTLPTCTAAGTVISSPTIDITAFEITPRDATGAVNADGNRIDLRLAGRLVGDTSVVIREYRTTVFIRSGRS